MKWEQQQPDSPANYRRAMQRYPALQRPALPHSAPPCPAPIPMRNNWLVGRGAGCDLEAGGPRGGRPHERRPDCGLPTCREPHPATAQRTRSLRTGSTDDDSKSILLRNTVIFSQTLKSSCLPLQRKWQHCLIQGNFVCNTSDFLCNTNCVFVIKNNFFIITNKLSVIQRKYFVL